MYKNIQKIIAYFTLVCILLAGVSLNTVAGYSKINPLRNRIEEETAYKKIRFLETELKKMVETYYDALVFDTKNANKIYKKIEAKIVSLNKINLSNKYRRRQSSVESVISSGNIRVLRNKMKIKNINFDRYNSRQQENFFVKKLQISLSQFQSMKDVEGIYFGIQAYHKNTSDVSLIEMPYNKHSDSLPNISPVNQVNNKYLAPIYTEKTIQNITQLTPVDLKEYTGEYVIDFAKLFPNMKKDDNMHIIFNVFLKKGDVYISLLNYSAHYDIGLNHRRILQSFESQYRRMYNSNTRYLEDNNFELKKELEHKLLKKLSSIFSKIKNTYTIEQYKKFLHIVRKKVIAFQSNGDKYKTLTANIFTQKMYDVAFEKFGKIKEKEKVVSILLLFLNNEISEVELEGTISEFIQ